MASVPQAVEEGKCGCLHFSPSSIFLSILQEEAGEASGVSYSIF
jgi:hypothetical protein